MTLQTKTLACLGIAMLLVTALLHQAGAFLLRSSFDELERQQLERNGLRVQAAIGQELEVLRSKSGDWAAWDETYEFVTGRNDDYAEWNLTAEAMKTLQLDFMVFVNSEGRIVKGCHFGAGGWNRTDPPPGLLRHLQEGEPLLDHDSVVSVRSGIVAILDSAALVCSRPIVASDVPGPIVGTLVVGRMLDAAMIQRLCHQTQLSIKLALVHDTGRSGGSEPWSVRVVDEGAIEGTLQLDDLHGDQVLTGTIVVQREVHARGEQSLRVFTLSLFLIGTIGLVLALFLTNRFVIARITRMRDLVRQITETSDLEQQLPPQGNDELGELAGSFNAMTATLARAHAELERASEAKSEFLANMSHEIRTPMTAILGYADLLANADQTPDERAESVRTIRRNGDHLLTMINDLLDLSKVEAGQIVLETIECDVRALVAEVVTLLRPLAAAKGLDLSLASRGVIPGPVRTDPTRLEQILLNLVGNAIKFTEHGSVQILVSHDAERRSLTFEVVDTGIGMDEAAIARLFRPFSQADSSTTRRFGGTGLGLVLSRRLARLLGGDVTCVSAPGRGSTFTLVIADGVAEPVAPNETLPVTSS